MLDDHDYQAHQQFIKKFMQTIGIVICLIAGFFTWWLGFAFSASFDVSESLIISAPIMLVIFPTAIRAFKTKSPVMAVFLLAIAPVLVALNFFPFSLFLEIGEALLGTQGNDAMIFAKVFCVFPWLFVAWLILKPAKKQ